MPPSRLLVGSLLRFALVYGLLMAPWPGVHGVYRALFTATGEAVFSAIGPAGDNRIRPSEGAGQVDTTIFVTHRETGAEVSMGINSRQVGYLPTAVFCALALATPVRWPRRLINLLGGLFLVHVFVGVRLLTMILYGVFRDVSSAAATAPTLWDKSIATTVLFVGVGQPISYIVPILIWGLVSLLAMDLTKFLAAGSTPPVPSLDEVSPADNTE